MSSVFLWFFLLFDSRGGLAVKRALDVIFLLGLAIFILAGTPLAPFHGDEATQIFMSRDFAYQYLLGQPERVRYANPPVSAQEQELRLLNGTVNKTVIGLAWSLAGFGPDDLNEQWDWGADWDYNWSTGHAPSRDLLVASRWPSSLFLIAGMLALFGLGWSLSGRSAAWLAALFYALHPVLLLNGRRAMMEGSLIAFTALAALLAVRWLLGRGSRAWLWAALFGLAAGLALASKHTALFAVVPLGAAVLGWELVRLRNDGARALARPFLQMMLAALIAGVVFYALNPAWWGDPLARAGDVLRLRNDLLAGQAAAFGGYAGPWEALRGGLRQIFAPVPQYYEVAGWGAWLAPEIAAYESSGLSSLTAAWPLTLATLGLFALGVWTLGQRGPRPEARWIAAVWLLSALAAAFLFTPLEWQRYYLPVYPALVWVTSLGAARLWLRERRQWSRDDDEG